MTEMPASRRVCQHMRQKDALIDFKALFVAQRTAGFGGNLRRARREARNRRGGRQHQILKSDEAGAVKRQLVIDGRNVRSEKSLAMAAGDGENTLRRRDLDAG